MAANVQLSPEELRLVSDPAWILTKNSIVRKVVEMFGELSGVWREVYRHETDPRVFKGENYKGMPWVMLDYPRAFSKEEVLAVRTMFWWGHCFSMTLHLKGTYLRSYLPVIHAHLEELKAAGFWPGMSDDEWEHEHKPGEWEIIGTGATANEGVTNERSFLKLTVTIGFDRWDTIETLLTEKFAVLKRLLVA